VTPPTYYTAILRDPAKSGAAVPDKYSTYTIHADPSFTNPSIVVVRQWARAAVKAAGPSSFVEILKTETLLVEKVEHETANTTGV
jgi:hypothetical protein